MPVTPSAEPPFVVTLDVGSSSVRALCFDARGRALGRKRQLGYEPSATPDGGVEIDADRLLELTAEALDGLLADLGPRAEGVAAVAISTFWHTLLGVRDDGRASTPLYSWADTRSAGAVEALRACLDERAYHARTGCALHTSYLPARLLWLRTVDPRGFAAAHIFMSFGEYLLLRLFGEARCSVSMASGTGLFDQRAQTWDRPALEALGLTPDRLAPLVDLEAPFRGLRPESAKRWPALARVPWLPALGDGACSNIGAGCVAPDRIALMVGTSGAMRVCWRTDAMTIPAGLWCYRVDRRRILLGGALSNGGNLYAWFMETLRLGSREETERELAAMPPDAHGLTVLPFLAGERSTGWVAAARAAIAGLSLATRPIDILRAGLETVAYRFALIHALLAEACPRAEEVVATGGALAASPAWTQIMADVLGVPVRPSTEAEASSRGAALLALEALGAVPSLEAVPAGFGPTVGPDPARHARYREGLARHRQLYEALIPLSESRPRPSAAIPPGRSTA
ncbi:MAG: gluconokinase [Candidatus Rokubacteria bacterium]|nr:gluconokinase [Candidatus Rokubacteria bacterium]